MKAIFPGSFNPFTIGHLDILSRALRAFDEVVLAIGYNEHKGNGAEMIENADHLRNLFKDCPNVSVELYSGLTVAAAARFGAGVIVRGIRNAADSEYELQLAHTNREISPLVVCGNDNDSPDSHPEIDTWLIPCRAELSYISSSMVRELIHNGFPVDRFIPTPGECLDACRRAKG